MGFAVLMQLNCILASAQFKEFRYGMGAALGVRQGQVNSDFTQLHGMNLWQEGGSIFLMTESRFLSSKLQGGFYFSGTNVPHTTDLFEGSLSVNVHPLHLDRFYKGRFSPYIITGISAGRHNFYGFYAHTDEPRRNYSVGVEPYVGSLMAASLNTGIGVRLHLPMNWQFIQFFAEASKVTVLTEKRTSKMSGTGTDNGIAVNLGLAFGFRRHVR